MRLISTFYRIRRPLCREVYFVLLLFSAFVRMACENNWRENKGFPNKFEIHKCHCWNYEWVKKTVIKRKVNSRISFKDIYETNFTVPLPYNRDEISQKHYHYRKKCLLRKGNFLWRFDAIKGEKIEQK